MALVLEWLDARVADILLSPTGISTSSSPAISRTADTLSHPVSEMVGGGSSSNNSGSSSVADVGTSVVVELVDWFDQQISSLFGGATATNTTTNGNSADSGGIGDSGISSDNSGQDCHGTVPLTATPSPLGAGLVASLVESVFLGLGACALTSSEHPSTHTPPQNKSPIHISIHLLTHLPLHQRISLYTNSQAVILVEKEIAMAAALEELVTRRGKGVR